MPRQTQWFYFRVEGMSGGGGYTFHILNFMKRTSLYSKGRADPTLDPIPKLG